MFENIRHLFEGGAVDTLPEVRPLTEIQKDTCENTNCHFSLGLPVAAFVPHFCLPKRFRQPFHYDRKAAFFRWIGLNLRS